MAVKCDQYNGKVPMTVWQKVYPFIKEACEYSFGEYTPELVLQNIEGGKQQLWTVSKGNEIVWVWVTEIYIRHLTRLAFVAVAGGRDLEAGIEFWPLMSFWMKEYELETAECQCRPSVARLLKKKLPFRTKYEVLTIEPEE